MTVCLYLRYSSIVYLSRQTFRIYHLRATFYFKYRKAGGTSQDLVKIWQARKELSPWEPRAAQQLPGHGALLPRRHKAHTINTKTIITRMWLKYIPGLETTWPSMSKRRRAPAELWEEPQGAKNDPIPTFSLWNLNSSRCCHPRQSIFPAQQAEATKNRRGPDDLTNLGQVFLPGPFHPLS